MRFGQEHKTNHALYPIYLHNTSTKGNVRIHVYRVRKMPIDNEDYYLILVEAINSEIKQQKPTSSKKPNQQYLKTSFHELLYGESLEGLATQTPMECYDL